MRDMPARLVYFENWMDPVAERMLKGDKGSRLERLRFADAPENNWRAMEAAHGYQLLAGYEIREPFVPKRPLIARCPNLLAISTNTSPSWTTYVEGVATVVGRGVNVGVAVGVGGLTTFSSAFWSVSS